MDITIILLLLALIAVGVPITFALGVASLMFFVINDIPMATFAQRLAVGVDSFPLLAAPFFILAGNLMNTGGITNKIFRFANSMVGYFRGALGYVNILGSMMFAGMSGSAIADAAGLGSIEIKAMTDQGYDVDFSASVTAASSIIGPIIPPSTIMIVYGVTAGTPIDRLFMGGIIPGILLGLAFAVLVYFYSRKNNYPRNESFKFSEFFDSFKETFWALLAPVIIIGGILLGICTPTEAGAIAAFYSLVISIYVYKELKWKDIPKVLFDTAMTSGVILFIVSTASIFGWCLTFARVPQTIAQLLASTISSKFLLLILFTIIYLFLGMIMEASAIVITTVPIFVPLCTALGIDLVYFGVLIAILMAIGTVTPPVGTVMFITCKITGMGVERYTRNMIPWICAMLAVVLLLVIFPQLVTFVPNLLLK
jgi:tripartite ATP-independent transporter DctM subunit